MAMGKRSSDPNQKMRLLMEQSKGLLEDPRYNKTRLKRMPTASEMINLKRTKIRDNRADFRKKMKAHSKGLRRIYHLWRRRINRAARNRFLPHGPVDVVLYSRTVKLPEVGKALHYIPHLVRLLRHPVNGWSVRVNKNRGKNFVQTIVTVTIW